MRDHHERITIFTGSPAGLLRLLGWRGIAALAAGLTLAVVLVLLAGALFLLIFPIALAAGLVARWLAGRRADAVGARAESVSITVRDGMVEIEPERVEILPPRRRG